MATDQIPERTEQSPYVVGFPEDEGGGIDVVGIVVGVWGFLSGLFRGRIDGAVKRALEGLRDGIKQLGKAIVDGVAWLAHKLAAAIDSVKRFIQRTFGPLYDMLKKFVQRVQRILDKVVGPVIDFLEKVRAHVMAIYRDVVKPILDIIEFIRLPLKILSQFGVTWAKKLDATLAEVEDTIVENFQLVLGKLNQTINLLNEIVDVDRLLKRITLVRSLMRDFQFTNNIWWNSQTRPLSDRQLHNYQSKIDPTEPAAVAQEMRTHFATGNAEISAAIRESIANVRISLRKAA